MQSDKDAETWRRVRSVPGWLIAFAIWLLSIWDFPLNHRATYDAHQPRWRAREDSDGHPGFRRSHGGRPAARPHDAAPGRFGQRQNVVRPSHTLEGRP